MTDRTERAPSAFRLNLEQQKNRAKELLRAVKAGDAEALSRFAVPAGDSLADRSVATRSDSVTPDSPDAPQVTKKLADAQFVIARELRFSSWAKLKAHIQSMDQERAAIDQKKPAPDADLKTLHIRCGHDIQERIAEAFIGDFWLAHLLAHYANAKRPRVLELIALNEFPGAERFTGMGQLPSEALRMLWSRRKPVTPTQLALGNDVWNAFSSDDPRHLAAIFRSGTPALPIMAPALHRLLRELPSVKNGLRLTEQLILQIVSEGTVDKPMLVWMSVWPRFATRDPVPSSVPDLGFLGVIRDMLAGPAPLLNFTRDPPLAEHTTVLLPQQLAGPCRQILTITEFGRAVLNGERDWHAQRPFPRWVGGVHIQPGVAGWRWDEARRDAVFRES